MSVEKQPGVVGAIGKIVEIVQGKKKKPFIMNEEQRAAAIAQKARRQEANKPDEKKMPDSDSPKPNGKQEGGAPKTSIENNIQKQLSVKESAKGSPLTRAEKLGVLAEINPELKGSIDVLQSLVSQPLSIDQGPSAVRDRWVNIQKELALIRGKAPPSSEYRALVGEIHQVADGYYYDNINAFKSVVESEIQAEILEYVDSTHYERNVAKDIVANADASNRSVNKINFEDRIESLPWPPKTYSIDAARSAINAVASTHPWMRETLGQVEQSADARSFLASLAEAGPEALNDPAYLFMKGTQFRIKNEGTLMAPSATDPDFQGVHKLTKVLSDQVKTLIPAGGKQLFTDRFNDDDWYLHRFMTIEGATMGVPPVGATDILFDGVSTSIPDLDKLLTSLEYDLKNFTGSKSDTDGLDEMQKKLRELFVKQPNPAVAGPIFKDYVDRLNTMKKDALTARLAARPVRGSDIHEPYSGDLYLDPQRRLSAVINLEWTLNEMIDKENSHIVFWGQGPFSQTSEREIQKVVSYVRGDQYEDDVRWYFDNNKIQVDQMYPTATGITRAEDHPFYQERLMRFKEVSETVTARAAMQQTYGGFKTGIELEKVGQMAAGLGDAGIMRILNGNGGLNGEAYVLIDTVAMRWAAQNGAPIRVDGLQFERMIHEVKEEFLANKELYKERYQQYWGKDEKGMDYELTDQRALAIVREAQLLYTVTLRDATAVDRGLGPMECEGQNGQSGAFAGAMGLELPLRARGVIKWFTQRWDLANPAEKLHLETMARMWGKELFTMNGHSTLSLEQSILEKTAGLTPTGGTPEQREQFLRLAAYAFNIVEKDPTKRKIAIESALKRDLRFDERGFDKHKKIPTSFEDLTLEQLQDRLIVREGIKAVDTILGGYDYQSSGYYVPEMVKFLDKTFGEEMFGKKKGFAEIVGLGYRKRFWGNKMIGAEDHHAMEEAVLELTKDGGVLPLQADYTPLQNLQDLVEHHNGEAFTFIKDKLLSNPSAVNLFDGRSAKRRKVLSADSPEGIWQEASKPFIVIDGLLTDSDLPLINYHNFTVAGLRPGLVGGLPGGISSADILVKQKEIVDSVCTHMGIKSDEYLKFMQKISSFVREDKQIMELVRPEYLDSYRTTQALDPRMRKVETYLRTNISAGLPDEYKDKFSSAIGGEEGRGLMSAAVRTVLDNALAVKGTDSFITGLATKDVKKLEESTTIMAKQALFVGGRLVKNRAVAIYGGAYVKCAEMDRGKDLLLYGLAMTKSSPFQRVAGPNHISLGLNRAHHLWEDIEAGAGGQLKFVVPELASDIESDLGFIFKIKDIRVPSKLPLIPIKIPFIGGKSIYRFKHPIEVSEVIPVVGGLVTPINLYRLALLGTVVGVIGIVETVEEGKDAFGAGGGGGHGGH